MLWLTGHMRGLGIDDLEPHEIRLVGGLLARNKAKRVLLKFGKLLGIPCL